MINSLGIYCGLTIPFFTKILFGFGLIYPFWLIVLLAILSATLSNKLTTWEVNKINEKNKKNGEL